MKNKFKTCGITTIIYVEKDNETYEVIIDTEDLNYVSKIESSWKIFIIQNKMYVKYALTTNKETVYIPLTKYILKTKDHEHIKFMNNNRLDFRKSNLYTNKDLTFNQYELRKNGNIEIILTDYLESEKARTIINVEDLEKIVHYKYRWRYSNSNNTPSVYSRDDNGNKIYMEHIILNTTDFVKHLNNNILDNRKENLLIVNKKNKNKNKNKKKRKKKNKIKNNDKKTVSNNDLATDILVKENLVKENLTKINNECCENKFHLENAYKHSNNLVNHYNYSDENDFEFNF